MRYSIQRQLSVAIENKPGRLATIASLMSEQGINIRNLCVIDNIEQGMIRMVPSDPETCREILQKANYFVVETEVLVLILKDNPGQLASVCRALDSAGVNIEYAYGSEDSKEEEERIIFKVSNMNDAVKAISKIGS